MSTLSNVAARGGETFPPSVRFVPDAFPEARSSQTGVSLNYAPDPSKKWYILSASYGREDMAADYIISDNTYVYIAKRYVYEDKNGKRKKVLESLVPNILFVYTTEDKVEEYIKASPVSSFLSYYIMHIKDENGNKLKPIVTNGEMQNFIMATSNQSEHLLFVNEPQCHYKGGEFVRVTDGKFKGVVGRVARIAGQQRVVISISNFGLISTAYIPTAFLQVVK